VFRFIDREKATYPVRMMCRLLEVSPSGYYAWVSRPMSTREFQDQILVELVVESHRQSRRTYGAPRIHADLQEAGVRIGRKRVARLMRRAGICGAYRRRRFKTTLRAAGVAPAEDRVNRQFKALAPNRLWVADIKQIDTGEGSLFIAAVQDVFSRRVVGWSMREDLQTPIVVDALEMAYRSRHPSGVIHHSDQGCQYTSIAFGLAAKHAGIDLSMGSVGDCFDNALAESLWATLDRDLLLQQVFATRAEARTAIFDYIEGFYNPHRRHSALGYKSPAAHEAAWRAENADAA